MRIRKLKDFVCEFCKNKFKSRQHFQKFCKFKCYVGLKLSLQNKKLTYVVDKNGCWIWTHGKPAGSGYGQVFYNGACTSAHRFSWFIHNGKIPKGKHVLHRCDVRMCVNPDHLFLGTYKDNMADASKKGRMPRGEANNMSKLTEQDIINIRNEYVPFKVPLRKLGKKYGVTLQAIHHVVHKKNWRHVWTH